MNKLQRQHSNYTMQTNLYSPPQWLIGGHLQTIIPGLFRKIDAPYVRERLWLPDGDFLDTDWIRAGYKKIVVISHGLEGDSHRPYMKGMARHLHQQGFDVLAWNFRACSGELNKLPRFYHSGETSDLRYLLQYVQQLKQYEAIYLVGFSLGGNLTLKFLGENNFPETLKKAVVFSVPTDLSGASDKLATGISRVYSQRFLNSLSKKIEAKAQLMPQHINAALLPQLRNLRDFDEVYTAPLHGFQSAQHYYDCCNANKFIPEIRVPTLIINALNDPFLSSGCYPFSLVKNHDFVALETPSQGGHCGFVSGKFNHNAYWSERRAAAFLLS
jgi:predicted alpha/beta-fold hydrolase